MGQFLCALGLIPPALRLRVVGSFTLVGQPATAPTSPVAQFLFFRHPLNSGSLFRAQLASEFVKRLSFSNSHTRIFLSRRSHYLVKYTEELWRGTSWQ
jgi:hypothetical protein